MLVQQTYDQTTPPKTYWFSDPTSSHLVQFYKTENKLLHCLYEFIYSGLAKGEICIVIAMPFHARTIIKRLNEAGVNTDSNQLIMLDAVDTLEKFMMNGLPDKTLFMNTVGAEVYNLTKQGKPIRAYGEMVAHLWKENNEDAVMQLEELWNELGKTYSFSLFCAYPELHFVMDKNVRKKIAHCHHMEYGS